MDNSLTRRQTQALQRHRRLIADVIDICHAIHTDLEAAHVAAALHTTADAPGSAWAGDSGSRPVGSHSDPTGTAAAADAPYTAIIGDTLTQLIAWRDHGYGIHQRLYELGQRLATAAPAADLEELDRDNIGYGACDACGRHCTGQGNDRRRTVRKADPYRVGLAFCDACRVAWQRAEWSSDRIYEWCDMRRRRVERTILGKEPT